MRWAIASFLASALMQLASCSDMSADGDQTDISGSQCVDKPLWRVTLQREQTIYQGDETSTYRICEMRKDRMGKHFIAPSMGSSERRERITSA
jgi:hypothetical protein